MSGDSIGGGIIKDKDIIRNGDLSAPRAFFQDLGAIRILLYRMQNECDVHANALATQALSLLDETLKRGEAPAELPSGNIPC